MPRALNTHGKPMCAPSQQPCVLIGIELLQTPPTRGRGREGYADLAPAAAAGGTFRFGANACRPKHHRRQAPRVTWADVRVA